MNFISLWNKLDELLLMWLRGYAPQSPQNAPTEQPASVPTATLPLYDWSTPQKAKHSVRVICDEEGLTLEQKNTLCATIAVESGFNPKAVNHNRNYEGIITSTDYGIAQINDYYHIGKNKDFPSVDFVLQNPDSCIRWMCKMWKAEKRNLWVAYSSGRYKSYL